MRMFEILRIESAVRGVLLVNGLTESTLNSCFVTLMLGIACRYAAENRRNLKPNEHKV